MDNRKTQPHDKLGQYNKNTYGFAVKTHSAAPFNPNHFVFEQTVLLTDIRNQTSSLKNKQQTTVWVYEAVITSPKYGSLTFMVDKHNCQFAIDIQGKKSNLAPQDSFEQVTLDNLQEGEQIKVTLTATTDGSVPIFRFLWDASNDISHIPDQTIYPLIPTHPSTGINNNTIKSAPINYTRVHNALTDQMSDSNLRLGNYKNRGRVSIVHRNSRILKALTGNPEHSVNSQASFNWINWLVGKPRISGENKQSNLLSLSDSTLFSGSNIHHNQNLFVESFNSPHVWKEGESRAKDQISDLLLPSGQWHRHYDTVIIPANANDQQIELIRHWLELTGGSVIIIQDKKIQRSIHVQQFIDDIDWIPKKNMMLTQSDKPITLIDPTNIQEKMIFENNDASLELTRPLVMTKQAFNIHGFQQVISLPSKSINALNLTNKELENAEYFSITINSSRQKTLLKLDDIPLSKHDSWDSLAQEIESKVNQQLVPLSQPSIKIRYKNNQLVIYGNRQVFSQFQLKKNQTIHHIKDRNELKISNENNQTIYKIDLNKDYANCWTHLSFKLIDSNNCMTGVYQEQFKHLGTQFNTPEQFAEYLQRYLHLKLDDESIQVYWDERGNNLCVVDAKNRELEEFQFSYNNQIIPIVVAENPTAIPHKLVVGAVTGILPNHEDIDEFQLIEKPQFGEIQLNSKTGKWQYNPDKERLFSGAEQFDFIAKMKDGSISAPMSIQLQAETAPIVSIPGKRTFSIKDPIYHEPQPRYYSVPADMQIHHIQLAQTHLQRPDSPYFNLTANRWALLKVDITSLSLANAPDFVAIITDKQGNELGRVRLTGPDKLPQSLLPIPNTPHIAASELHQQSYTAPLKGEWMQPDIQVRIMANNQPITMPYTDENGFFALNIKPDNHLISHVTNTSLYQQGHGIYAYSPLNWGLEAANKLPVTQFTLYSYPATPDFPALPIYMYPHFYDRTLVNPQYDNATTHPYLVDAQIAWAYLNSKMSLDRNSLNSEFHYSSINKLMPPSMKTKILGLGQMHHSGGESKSGVLFHELYGHGLKLPHTTDTQYPFSSKSHGDNIGYDQQRQQYTTYRYTSDNDNKINESQPTMYPQYSPHTTDQYDAFLAHSDYFTLEIQKFLMDEMRWQPNAVIDQDTEDNGFVGEGFYQKWSSKDKKWIILNNQNFTQYYREEQQHLLIHKRDVPTYWIRGQFIKNPTNNKLHPYSAVNVIRSIGHLPADYHNLITHEGRPFHPYYRYALQVTYATETGLLTEKLQIPLMYDEISMNIPDKGELVKFDILEINKNKQTVSTFYHYSNPESLANRILIHSDGQTLPKTLQLDNYWRGSKLFWSATDKNMIDFPTGKLNYQRINAQSAICASWVENGQLHQQYFSLNDPFGKNNKVDTTNIFQPINHFDIQNNERNIADVHLNVLSETRLLSDVHINQQIDIRKLGLIEKNNQYWATLVIYDEQGNMQEKTPLETWFLSVNQNILSVKGTIDSTPGLKIAGIKVYIDQHLHDDVAANSIWIHQNTQGTLAENTKLLDYDRPVIFNSIEHQPELLASLPKHEDSLIGREKANFHIPSTIVPMPIAV